LKVAYFPKCEETTSHLLGNLTQIKEIAPHAISRRSAQIRHPDLTTQLCHRTRRAKALKENEEKEGKYYCSVCCREISKEEYEAYDGFCWECWDDRMTEEIDTTEGTDEEFVPM